jgi:uncharacterized protein (DUF952 family)
MKILFGCLAAFLALVTALPILANDEQTNQTEASPQYLYKVISSANWQKSQVGNEVVLSVDDIDFIHLSKEDQLDKITKKYWSNIPEYVILKIDTSKLPGKLVYEANLGGSNKYYHLYKGSIPKSAIVDAKTVTSKK